MIHKDDPDDYTTVMKDLLSISYSDPVSQNKACEFAQQHQLPCLDLSSANSDLVLNFSPEYIELRDLNQNTSIHVDFLSGALAHRRQYGGGRGQAIAKAIGLKQGIPIPSVLDATAGLGKDAYILACLGCNITLVERSPFVAELVKNAVDRARDDEVFQGILKRGFTLVQDDAIDYMEHLTIDQQPDVVYLDPMYPERKKSAQVKKNMQMLQRLLGHDDEDTQRLLDCALSCARKRVVVKRPKGAKSLSEQKPTFAIESKKTRYDIYVIMNQADTETT